jgi:hypothetical protein
MTLESFNAAVTTSEAQRHCDQKLDNSAQGKLTAQIAHWERVIALAKQHGCTCPNVVDALGRVTSLAGVI